MTSETFSPIKVGIISAGMIAQDGHIRAYQQFPDAVSVEAICDVQIERAKAAAEKFGIPHWFASAEEMLRVCKPDLVSVCSPNCTHAAYIDLALDAGAHVLCEKPLSLSYREAERLFAKAEQKGLMLEACQTLRFNAEYMAAHDYAASGALGEVTYGSCTCIRRRGTPMRGAFLSSALNGGGALADIGVHFLDAILWMMGTQKVLAVTGMKSSNIIHKERGVAYSARESGAYGDAVLSPKVDPALCDVEEFASGVIRLEGNIGVNFCVAWSANQPAVRNMTILGDEMGLTLPDLKFYGTSAGRVMDMCPTVLPLEQYSKMPFPGHCYLIRNVIQHLTQGVPLFVQPAETIRMAAVLELFYKSCDAHREVALSEL